MCEGFVGLDLIGRYGYRVRPLGHPKLPVQKRKKSREAVQVHDGTSKMMVKFTALGVVHDETEHVAKESGEGSLSQTKRRRNEKIRTTLRKPRKRRESPVNRRHQTVFAHASEGSDAESKSEMKWCGVQVN